MIKFSVLRYFDRTQSINGMSATILNIEPLTTRLKNYFNCSTLAGAYMENQGGSGSAGSHFERRIFYNEVQLFLFESVNADLVYDR